MKNFFFKDFKQKKKTFNKKYKKKCIYKLSEKSKKVKRSINLLTRIYPLSNFCNFNFKKSLGSYKKVIRDFLYFFYTHTTHFHYRK